MSADVRIGPEGNEEVWRRQEISGQGREGREKTGDIRAGQGRSGGVNRCHRILREFRIVRICMSQRSGVVMKGLAKLREAWTGQEMLL